MGTSATFTIRGNKGEVSHFISFYDNNLENVTRKIKQAIAMRDEAGLSLQRAFWNTWETEAQRIVAPRLHAADYHYIITEAQNGNVTISQAASSQHAEINQYYHQSTVA